MTCVMDSSGARLNRPWLSVSSRLPPDCTLSRENPPGTSFSRAPGETKPDVRAGCRSPIRQQNGHRRGQAGAQGNLKADFAFGGFNSPGDEWSVTIRLKLKHKRGISRAANYRFFVTVMELASFEAHPEAVNCAPLIIRGVVGRIPGWPARYDSEARNRIVRS